MTERPYGWVDVGKLFMEGPAWLALTKRHDACVRLVGERWTMRDTLVTALVEALPRAEVGPDEAEVNRQWFLGEFARMDAEVRRLRAQASQPSGHVRMVEEDGRVEWTHALAESDMRWGTPQAAAAAWAEADRRKR